MNKKRVFIASLFLLLFGIIQFAELHVLGHEDDDQGNDCHLCQFVSEHHVNSFLGSEIIEIPSEHIVPASIVIFHYEQSFFNTKINYSFLNRPPPSA